MPKNKILKRDDGRYHYRTTTPSGQRLQIYSKKDELLKDFKERCNALDQITPAGDRTERMDDLFQLWVDLHVKPNLSKGFLRTTLPIYRKHVQPYIGKKRISEVSRTDVYTILSKANTKRYSASYIKHIRLCISAPFNFAVNTLGYPLTVPTQGLRFVSKQRQASQVRIISPADLERILAAAEDSKYYNYFRVLSLTGLRPSEALGLQAKDVTKTHLQIRRGVTIDGHSNLKTSAAKRDIPLYPELKSVLHDQRNTTAFRTKEGWLFPSEVGAPSMEAIRSAFKRILKQTAEHERGGGNGLKKLKLVRPAVQCTLYDFRHTFATRMAESGMDLLALKTIMGHEDVSITMKYYVAYTDKMEEVATEIMQKNLG